MPFSALGGQFYSISVQGPMLFQQGPISTGIGGVVIDLASAPIPPGDYSLHISTAVGGVDIYLPRYVQHVVEGSSLIGGKDIHSGIENWQKLLKVVHGEHTGLSLPEQPPEFVTATFNEEQAVRIHFFINRGVGGINIYQI